MHGKFQFRYGCRAHGEARGELHLCRLDWRLFGDRKLHCQYDGRPNSGRKVLHDFVPIDRYRAVSRHGNGYQQSGGNQLSRELHRELQLGNKSDADGDACYELHI